MHLTNKIVEEVGADKLLHFLLTAWLVAEAKIYGVFPMMIVFVAVIILGMAKEKWLDEKADYTDVWWSVLGGFASLLLAVISDFVL